MESTPPIQSKLKEFRASRGLTQEQLAEKLDVTRQTIIALEQEKYQPSLYLAWKCAKLFRVPIEKIFTFKK